MQVQAARDLVPAFVEMAISSEQELLSGNSTVGRHAAPGSRRWSAAALLLVVALLLGSVLIPARFTSRILRLLGDSKDVLEPARRAESELELSLDAEATALQEYALTGDNAVLLRHHAASLDTDRRLAALELYAKRIDDRSVGEVSAVRTAIAAWRQQNPPLSDEQLSRSRLTTLLRAEQVSRDSMAASVARLESYLASVAAAGRERVAVSEEHSLAVNASLVLVALATMFAVAALVRRERLLSAMLERRIEDEAALREAAEAFASRFENDDLTNEVVHAAMDVLRARAAFVEELADNPASGPHIIVRAAMGLGVPPAGTTAERAGSLTETVVTTGEPTLVARLGEAELSRFPGESPLTSCSCIVLPLMNAKERIGALFAMAGQDAVFGEDDLERARTFGHLISLAYEKVRLLNEAREGRRELERVLNSRSRLMRGFSHDIKNPLGAADGYADLLASGIYGDLSGEQRQSVERVRELIQTSLGLIADLHELARAETGKVTLYRERVVLQDVVRASGEEFHAAAARRGLALVAELPDEALTCETDALRVRQILSNLVSNAIKYTATGSVVLRLSRTESTADEAWATIEVADTGRGIPEDQLPLLFEEFVRLGASDQPGAGLGLAISQRLAEILGGRITVQSVLGRGSRFSLWIPMSSLPGSAAPRPDDNAEYGIQTQNAVRK